MKNRTIRRIAAGIFAAAMVITALPQTGVIDARAASEQRYIIQYVDMILDDSHDYYGYILDESGNTLYMQKNARIDEFHDGIAMSLIYSEDSDRNSVEYVDSSGKIIYRADAIDNSFPFSDGLALICKNNNFYFINKKGKIVIKGLSWARPFSNGYAMVGKKSKKHSYNDIFFINTRGKKAFSSAGIRPACPFSEGLAVVLNTRNLRQYVINTKGKKVFNIPAKFYLGDGGFSDGLLYVHNGGNDYFVNKKGKTVIKLAKGRSYSDQFKDGLCEFTEGGKTGYINKKGEVIALDSPERDLFTESDGMIEFRENDKYGYYNANGDVLKAVYEEAEEFKGGYAVVKENGKTYVIDKQGRKLRYSAGKRINDNYFLLNIGITHTVAGGFICNAYAFDDASNVDFDSDKLVYKNAVYPTFVFIGDYDIDKDIPYTSIITDINGNIVMKLKWNQKSKKLTPVG